MSKKVSATNKLTAKGILYNGFDGKVKLEVDGKEQDLTAVLEDFFDKDVVVTVTSKKTFAV